MEEIWKEIKDYEGLYWVSNLGHVKNKHNKILVPEIRNSYYSVNLSKNGVRTHKRIHRLVAEAFIPNSKKLPMVNHKDENKLNNNVTNLEWCDNTYNTHYSRNEDLSVYCFDLDKNFRSASEASVHTGICRTSIIKACRGQLKQAGGKIWCYTRDKDKICPR